MENYSNQQSGRQSFVCLFIGILIFTIFFSVPLPVNAFTVNYSYDQSGRLTDVIFNNDKKITYTYDNAGNLLSKTQNQILPAPALTVTTSGINVSLSWTSVPGAIGYSLVYAPYPYTDPDSIGIVDMGTNTSFSINLWTEAAYYVAIQAYNSDANSDYSNVKFFSLQ